MTTFAVPDEHQQKVLMIGILSTGLALILVFIGVKLILHYGRPQSDAIPEIGTATSLAVSVAILLAARIASVTKTRRDPALRAHAGSLRGHPPAPAETSPEATETEAPRTR